MRFYVAGKWEERKICRALMKELQRRGHGITRNWTKRLGTETDELIALCDEDAVLRADIVVIIALKQLPYKGAYVELGIGLAADKQIVLIGQGFEGCVFIAHPAVKRYDSIEAFLENLKS